MNLQQLFAAIVKTAQKEFAPGIPEARTKSTIPSVKKEDEVLWDFVEHLHDADRAGLHSDFRLSNGVNAFSWAIRKGIPDIGQKHLAIRQPDHTPEYMRFSGEISDGYGKGKVQIRRSGKAKIITSNNGKIHFALIDKQNPEVFSLINTGADDWLLYNTTPTSLNYSRIPQSKPDYKNLTLDELENYLSTDYLMTAKLDGAHMLYDFNKPFVQAFSYRPSKKSSALINHTFISGLDQVKTPDVLKGSIFRGELIATKDGKVLPAREIAGILNSSPQKGLEKLKEEGIKIKHALFDVVQKGKKNFENQPYEDKFKIIKETVKKLPDFIMPAYARSREDKLQLITDIRENKYPLTHEGVVLWDMKSPNPPAKLKNRPAGDVYITRIFEGSGRKKGMAGGYEYSLTPNGKTVGSVGTGFSDEQAKEWWKNRKDYVGTKSVINHAGQMPSGAYMAASHDHFHM